MSFIKDCSDFIKGISDNEEYTITTFLGSILIGFLIG